MIDLETIMKRIEALGVEEITTKELKKYGLNDYYIKKAIQDGKLEKIYRGKYRLTNIVNEKFKKAYHYFNQFKINIFNRDFYAAYDSLYNNMLNKTNHNYDNHLVLYFTLLKEILGNKKDFTFLDTLDNFQLVGEKADNIKSYHQEYINFNDAVLSHNFEKAYHSIIEFKNAEKERKQTNNISTLLFYILTKSIMIKKRKAEIQTQQREEKRIYDTHFSQFEKNIKEDNYEEALKSLRKLLDCKYSYVEKIQHYINIIETYLEIKETQRPLPEKNIDYTLEHSRKAFYIHKLFNAAIIKNDFKTAYQNIEKCIYYSPNNKTFILYRTLLEKLMNQDQQNREKLEKERQEKERLEKERQEKEKQEKERLENKIIEYTINELIDLIHNKEYEKIQLFLEEYLKKNNNRTYFLALKLIKNLNTINKKETIFQEENPNYLNSTYQPFRRFFEALRYRDYEEAYEMVLVCEELGKNKEEFTVYRYIIEDILNSIKQMEKKKQEDEENNRRKKEIENKNAKLGEFVYIKNQTAENIKTIETLIEEKLNLYNEDDEEIIYNEYYLEMIEMLKEIKKLGLVKENFEQFTYDGENIEDNFFKAINEGDYISALSIMESKEWYQITENSSNKKYLPLYRNLLINIRNQLNENESSKRKRNNDECNLPFTEKTKLEIHIQNLKQLIQKAKYKEAYFYYQFNDLKGISKEVDSELQVFLPFLDRIITKEKEELTAKYKNALKRGEYDQAQQYLQQLKSWIDYNEPNRSIDYYQARLDSQRKEVITEDFVKKEQLYDAAKYYYKNKEYQESIELLNEYIERDQDLSAKGYLLRGRNYEQLKRFDEAREDYQKAITIIPEPNAYHRLGYTTLYNKNKEEALAYFLEYEKRRPAVHNPNLWPICHIYRELGNNEMSEKYKKMIKRNDKRKVKK